MGNNAGENRDRITIAIMALGGQGGGVLADWLIGLGNKNGYITQGTSVPGVAQRTGSTVYYVEMVREAASQANHPPPVLATMPVPGDVDIVIASELMEAGRAILRGFVTSERTTLIGSTHRVYAISEKSALGDGTAESARIIDAAERRARRFIGFDMDAAAANSGSVISSVMLGALAGSGALPFGAEDFETAIRGGGKAIEANLKGFAAGRDGALERVLAIDVEDPPPTPTTRSGHRLHARILDLIPKGAQRLAIEGVRRLMDYQDEVYAALYLDRLEEVAEVDRGDDDHRLTRLTARHLALWMAYEDTIRVADLKVRATRLARVRSEVHLTDGQLMAVTEYMHPRLQEVCETLPAAIGAAILGSRRLRRLLGPLFRKGRHVETTSLRWFILLRLLASMRRVRRGTMRYKEEQQRIEEWLDLVLEAARSDQALAAEIVENQVLLKGYSDTFERGRQSFVQIMPAARSVIGRSDAAERVRALRMSALADETGDKLCAAMAADGVAG